MPEKVSFTTPVPIWSTRVCHAAGAALHMPVKSGITTQMYRAPASHEHVSSSAWAAQVCLPTRQQYVSSTATVRTHEMQYELTGATVEVKCVKYVYKSGEM